MKIYGLQKLTLLDYPGKIAATLFAPGCNFRCPFCHNASMINGKGFDEISSEEVINFLEKRFGLLDGVCISGGEPLLQDGIEDFLKNIKGLGYSVKLDTNGQLFNRLKSLVENNLIDYVAMDIKSSFENYSKAIGIQNFDANKVKKSAEYLMTAGIPYEFRTTVVKEIHTAEDFHLVGKSLKDAEKYYLQSFKDSGDILTPGLSAYNKERMNEFLNILLGYIPCVFLR